MIWLFAAALLPGLYWDRGPETVPALKEAGIARVLVPAVTVQTWKAAGFDAAACDPAARVKAETPGVEYKMSQASATAEPWIDANGWRFLRDGGRAWYYDVPERGAALAAAEAYCYGVDAAIHAGEGELGVFGRMVDFLGRLGAAELPAAANIGIIDDGKDVTGEVLNLLARRNLLFRVVKAPDAKQDLNVKIGSREYPASEAADPYGFAQKLRYQLTDDRRLVRIYGSNVVLVRLAAGNGRARLHLLNYAPRPVRGLRVRVLGQYRSADLAAFGQEKAAVLDYGLREGGTEFTVPVIDTYAVVDLTK